MDNLAVVHSTIEKFASVFRENTFHFLYESDIQAFLFYELFKSINKNIMIEYDVYSRDNYKQERFIETSIVKTEYPTTTRFDLAIIDDSSNYHKDDVKKIRTDNELKNEAFWSLPVKIGIEIKYCQLGQKPFDIFNLLKKDLEKLSRYPKNGREFHGIGLLFFQSYSDKIQFEINDILNQEVPELKEGIEFWIIPPGGIEKRPKHDK
jgi:hypothetical protein